VSEKTISENLALYQLHHRRRLRQIRRELHKLERRHWWQRMKVRRRQPETAYCVIHL